MFTLNEIFNIKLLWPDWFQISHNFSHDKKRRVLASYQPKLWSTQLRKQHNLLSPLNFNLQLKWVTRMWPFISVQMWIIVYNHFKLEYSNRLYTWFKMLLLAPTSGFWLNQQEWHLKWPELTYHWFPTASSLREKWIDAINIKDWQSESDLMSNENWQQHQIGLAVSSTLFCTDL